MKPFIIVVGLFALSCGTEKQYFKKSLSKEDEIYLNDNDSLIKKFSGKANWYKQYWTANLLVKRNGKGFDVKLEDGDRHPKMDRSFIQLRTLTILGTSSTRKF